MASFRKTVSTTRTEDPDGRKNAKSDERIAFRHAVAHLRESESVGEPSGITSNRAARLCDDRRPGLETS